MFFKNYFFMVKSICVRAPSLPRLATVLVCQAGGKPSTWFPPETRRAENQRNYLLFPFLHYVELSDSKIEISKIFRKYYFYNVMSENASRNWSPAEFPRKWSSPALSSSLEQTAVQKSWWRFWIFANGNQWCFDMFNISKKGY